MIKFLLFLVMAGAFLLVWPFVIVGVCCWVAYRVVRHLTEVRSA